MLSEVAQLFTFYWDLAENKFSLILNSVVVRSRLAFSSRKDAIFKNVDKPEKMVWRIGQSYGSWVKKPEDRIRPRQDPFAISPTFVKWYFGAFEIIYNFQRKFKRQVEFEFVIYPAPPHPTSPPLGKNLARPSPPLDVTLSMRFTVY